MKPSEVWVVDFLKGYDVRQSEAEARALAEPFGGLVHRYIAAGHQTLTVEELTDRFYCVREQRNRLLWACQKALDAFDAANDMGKSTWSGDDVSEMRMAVAAARAIYQPANRCRDS